MKSIHRAGNSRKNGRPCQYCARSYLVSDYVAEESPFCRLCLPNRMATREREIGPTYTVELGDYLVITRLPPGTPDSKQS